MLGQTGQLGEALKRCLPRAGTVIATERGGERAPLVDLAEPGSIRQCVRAIRPDVVVNAAAYTAVDEAQKQTRLAQTVNATGPGILATELATTGGLLIHYSTDYVFDGKASRAYKPNDATAPVNAYGETKLAGEDAIRQSGVDYLILRTSMVYGAIGKNFATTMATLLKDDKNLRVVDDQITSPTWTRALAGYTTGLLANAASRGREWLRSRCGTYHVSGSGYCSRYEFVRYMATRLSVPESRLQPVATTEFPTPAERPRFSVLDCALAHDTFGLTMDRWESHLDKMLDELASASAQPPIQTT